MLKKEKYADIIDNFGKDKISDRYDYTKKKIDDFLRVAGFSDCAKCNERILYHVITDYFSDILRLKTFHSIENVNKNKITAYLVHWIIKRKPIVFLADYNDREKDIFVNERFCASLIINEALFDKEDITSADINAVAQYKEYIDLLLYYLKYRECNPQVIELVIASFKMGLLL